MPPIFHAPCHATKLKLLHAMQSVPCISPQCSSGYSVRTVQIHHHPSQHQTMPEKKPPTPVVNRYHFCYSPRASVSITAALVGGATFRLEMGRMGGWSAGVLLRIIANKTKRRERGAVAQSGDEMSMTDKFCFALPMPGTRQLEVEPSPEKSRKSSPQRIAPTESWTRPLLLLRRRGGWHQMPDFFIVVVIILARILSATRMPRPANTSLIVSTACFMLRADPCSSVIRAMAISLATLSTSSTMRNTSMAKATGLSLRAAQTDASQYQVSK